MKKTLSLLCMLLAIVLGSSPVFAQTMSHDMSAQPAESPMRLAERLTSIAQELAAGNLTPERLQALSAELLQLIPQETGAVAEPAAEPGEPSATEPASMMCKKQAKMAAMMSGGVMPDGMMSGMHQNMASGGMMSDGMMSGGMMPGMHQNMLKHARPWAGNAGPEATMPPIPFPGILPMLDDSADPLTMQMHGEMLKALGDILTKYSAILAEQRQQAAETGEE